MDQVATKIEEYKTLRNEILTSMRSQQSILRYGVTILAFLAALGRGSTAMGDKVGKRRNR